MWPRPKLLPVTKLHTPCVRVRVYMRRFSCAGKVVTFDLFASHNDMQLEQQYISPKQSSRQGIHRARSNLAKTLQQAYPACSGDYANSKKKKRYIVYVPDPPHTQSRGPDFTPARLPHTQISDGVRWRRVLRV